MKNSLFLGNSQARADLFAAAVDRPEILKVVETIKIEATYGNVQYNQAVDLFFEAVDKIAKTAEPFNKYWITAIDKIAVAVDLEKHFENIIFDII